MRDNVYVLMCEGSARRHRDIFCKLVAFSAVALVVLSLMTINPLYFGDGRASAAPGTPKLSTTYITLSSTATGTSLTPVPGTGFNLSDSASTAAFDVTTDNFTGYSIKITAADNDRTLVNTANSAQVINSISEPTAQSDFVATDQTLINHWGIKPNKYYNNGSTITNTETIFPAPNEAGLELDVTSTANASVANTYSVAVGAMLDSSIPSGTYTRETTIVVIPNPIYYVLNYNKNTGDNVTNLPESDSSSTTSTKITISSTAPERASYAFSGWCLGTTTTTDGVDSCDGTVFQPGDEFGIDQTVENTSTLYAMWQVNAFSCAAEYRLQNADGTYPGNYTSVGVIDSAVPYGQTCSYTSTQDSTLYTNQSASETVTGPTTLQLDIPRTIYTLTTTGDATNISSTTGSGTYRWGEEVSISATETTVGEFTEWTQTAGISSTFADSASINTTFTMPVGNATVTANSITLPEIQNLSRATCTRTPSRVYDVRDGERYTIQRLEDGRCWILDNLRLGGDEAIALTPSDTNIASDWTLPASIDSGFGSYTTAQINADSHDQSYSYGAGNGKVGVYYNYCAASAGTYCMAEGSGVDNATADVCPAGWRMPTGNTSGEYQTLYEAYSHNGPIFKNALHAILSGAFSGGSAVSQDDTGYFWSSTRRDSNAMYTIGVTATSAYPENYYGRNLGFPVRCVLDENVNMQNISKDYLDVAIPNNGDRIILTDTRDNNKYQVTKINGEVWMTQNLRITGTVTAEGSNFTGADFNVSEYSLDSNDSSYAGHCDNTNGYDYPCSKDSGSTTTGVWYNYAAASAGTITGSSNTTTTTQDICPAGWRLPTGPNTIANTDFNKLVGNTASDWQDSTVGLTAFGAVAGGYYRYGGSLANTGRGVWWSATAHSTSSRYNLFYDSSNGQFFGDDTSDRFLGFFVRCILDHTSIDDITTMQEFSTRSEAIKNSMTTNTVYTLTDTRDGESYKIAKLADGNVWMLENLNLAGGTALSAGDTDVTSEYIDGFATGGNLTKTGNTIILPASATKNSNNNKLTDSSQFSDNSNAYVFNSNNKTNCGAGGQNTPCYSYYSYIAATLGGKQADGATAETRNGYNAAASICPKGWKLPTSTTSNAPAATSPNWKTGDWYALATAYGANLENNNNQTSNTFYNNAGPGTTPNFLLAGNCHSGSFYYGGDGGYYWSATSGTYLLYFGSGYVYSASGGARYYGLSVRCLAR